MDSQIFPLGYGKSYRAVYPWLGPSITSRVSLEAGHVYNAIVLGNDSIESLTSEYTRVSPANLSKALKELLDMGAIYEDNDGVPDGFGYPFSEEHSGFMGNLEKCLSEPSYDSRDNFTGTFSRGRSEEEPLSLTPLLRNNFENANNNLMDIMSDKNLAAMADPSYVETTESSSGKQPSQEEMMAFMQQLSMQQPKK